LRPVPPQAGRQPDVLECVRDESRYGTCNPVPDLTTLMLLLITYCQRIT